MPAVLVVESLRAIQYTGSNSSEIDSAISDFSINSESGGTLNFTSGGNSYEVSTNGWIVYWQGQARATYTNAEYLAAYYEAPESFQASYGVAPAASTLVLNATDTIEVTVSPAMPDTSYTPQAWVGGAVGPLVVDDVDIVSTTQVDVTIRAAGAAYLGGAQVHVYATKP